jgi:hypothetical protein
MGNLRFIRHVTRRSLAPLVLMLAAFAALPQACNQQPKPPEHFASEQAAISLSTAENFAVLASSTVTNTGPTIINGEVGVSPGTAITGFPPGFVIPPATVHPGDAIAAQAQSDATAAYAMLTATPCTVNVVNPNLGGQTLTPGVYCFSSSAQLTGALVLDAQGDPNAVFIFKIGSTLTTATGASVAIINGGQACNVFWQVGSSATLGTATAFAGSILALASVTLTTNAVVSGRALALNGAVTMDTNQVSAAHCAAGPGTSSSGAGTGGAAASSSSAAGTGGAASSTSSAGCPTSSAAGTGGAAASSSNATGTGGAAATSSSSAGGGDDEGTGGKPPHHCLENWSYCQTDSDCCSGRCKNDTCRRK